jgi:hypothetical protein
MFSVSKEKLSSVVVRSADQVGHWRLLFPRPRNNKKEKKKRGQDKFLSQGAKNHSETCFTKEEELFIRVRKMVAVRWG